MAPEKRLVAGERVGMDEEVLLRGMPICVRAGGSGVLDNGRLDAASAEKEGISATEISCEASWTGDMWTLTEEGGVGIVRASWSRRIVISLLASVHVSVYITSQVSCVSHSPRTSSFKR